MQQGAALTGRNMTGPPCSFGRPTANAHSRRRADRQRARSPAAFPRSRRPPAGSVTNDDRRQNNTGPLTTTNILLFRFQLQNYTVPEKKLYFCL